MRPISVYKSTVRAAVRLLTLCLVLTLTLTLPLTLTALTLPFAQAAYSLSQQLPSSEPPPAQAASAAAAAAPPAPPPPPLELKDLKKDQLNSGFKCTAVYLNDSQKTIGARFKHERTGFTFDLMQIESLPQAFFWVNTYLPSDSGVAHTQEHLLLGKGNKGRSHGSRNQLMLVEESAGTDQWRTYYHFNTCAGKDVFYKVSREFLDLLLNPDYSDEEIRREVRNFKVREDSKTKKLTLEEAGTVYNEMKSYEHNASNDLWYASMNTVYGKGHPLSCQMGGSPEGIRKLQPAEIRAFHKANYTLDRMGMIASLPSSVPPAEMLAELNNSLNQLQKGPARSSKTQNNDMPVFPPPRPQAAGTIQIIDVADSKKSGTVEFIWPAQLSMSVRERMLFKFFLRGIAGDADTPLYKIFVDSKTQKVKSGATSTGSWVVDEQGHPAMISLYDVDQAHLNKTDIARYRSMVIAEIARVANWKDDSAELKEFNSHLQGIIRVDDDFVNRPPAFGSRGNIGGLMKQLVRLEQEGGFKRYITSTPDLWAIKDELRDKKNIWRKYVAKWHLLDSLPNAIATRPDPLLSKKQEAENQRRCDAEVERLKKLYKVTDAQAALRLYKADYDRITEKLEARTADTENLKFPDTVPMTFDDHLDYKVSSVSSGKVPLLSATFESMDSSNTYLALRLDSVPEEDLMYLGLLPNLLTDCGVIENGKALSYEKALERVRNEVFYVESSYSSNAHTGRYELKMNAAGSNTEESKRAVEWMKLYLKHPYWRVENLPRIRDVVDQALSGLRSTRDADYEENWDEIFTEAYHWQTVPLQLHVDTFLTQIHDTQRLKWQLKGDKSPETMKTFCLFMKDLASKLASCKRDDLQAILNDFKKQELKDSLTGPSKTAIAAISDTYKALSADAKSLVADAASDLMLDLPDLPDDSLASDWTQLCNEIAADSQVLPAKTLEKLDSIRERILVKGGARLAVVGPRRYQDALEPSILSMVNELSDEPFKPFKYSDTPLIFKRLKERMPAGTPDPVFAALVNPPSHYGVVINQAPSIKYSDIDDKSLCSVLAIGLYGGGGAHSLFMKTWEAGLAYGNGPSWGPETYIQYRADKMPSIPETLRFVAEQIRKSKKDPQLVDYTIAWCFSSRAGSEFGNRGEAMSDDLADGLTPEKVRKFREAILALGQKKGIADELYAEIIPQFGKIVPGLGTKLKDVPGGRYLAIGDDKQLSVYEDFLKSTEGPDTKLYRLYGRDFWVSH